MQYEEFEGVIYQGIKKRFEELNVQIRQDIHCRTMWKDDVAKPLDQIQQKLDENKPLIYCNKLKDETKGKGKPRYKENALEQFVKGNQKMEEKDVKKFNVKKGLCPWRFVDFRKEGMVRLVKETIGNIIKLKNLEIDLKEKLETQKELEKQKRIEEQRKLEEQKKIEREKEKRIEEMKKMVKEHLKKIKGNYDSITKELIKQKNKVKSKEDKNQLDEIIKKVSFDDTMKEVSEESNEGKKIFEKLLKEDKKEIIDAINNSNLPKNVKQQLDNTVTKESEENLCFADDIENIKFEFEEKDKEKNKKSWSEWFASWLP